MPNETPTGHAVPVAARVYLPQIYGALVLDPKVHKMMPAGQAGPEPRP